VPVYTHTHTHTHTHTQTHVRTHTSRMTENAPHASGPWWEQPIEPTVRHETRPHPEEVAVENCPGVAPPVATGTITVPTYSETHLDLAPAALGQIILATVMGNLLWSCFWSCFDQTKSHVAPHKRPPTPSSAVRLAVSLRTWGLHLALLSVLAALVVVLATVCSQYTFTQNSATPFFTNWTATPMGPWLTEIDKWKTSVFVPQPPPAFRRASHTTSADKNAFQAQPAETDKNTQKVPPTSTPLSFTEPDIETSSFAASNDHRRKPLSQVDPSTFDALMAAVNVPQAQ
jgi:hypothetical protein